MTVQRRLAILGAAGGLGRVLTDRALAEGWQILALDLATSLAAHPLPAGVEAIALDLRVPESIEAAFESASQIDAFVNLAGFMSPIRPLADVPLSDFDEVIEGNLRGAFLACTAALTALRKPGGAIVNVASGLAHFTRPGFGPYAAAKAGMISLTKTLALEAAPDIRVNAVAPSAVNTAFLSGGTGRQPTERAPVDLNAMAAAAPLKRMATPEDVADPILFLIGPGAAFMTGQILWVNGGAYMP